MNRRSIFTLTTMAMLGLAVTLPSGDAAAQQKQRVSFKAPAENSKYTQQTTIDVGDVPGHQVRVFEIHRTYPSNPPLINGVALKEQFQRGTSDFTDYNGLSTAYTVYVLENGDKFFGRASAMGHSTGGKRSTTSVETITGGTGSLVGMRGMIRASGAADPKAGFNETQSEIEYWIEK
jgi:hypothetical protein